VAVLLASVLLNMVLGDMLQYAAITRLGIALAMPITCPYPLVTLLIAMATLDERPSPRAAVGTVLIVVGVILVALPRRALAEEGEAHRVAPAAGH
jgi:drug/metabolite transporter (DMT)-like permease